MSFTRRSVLLASAALALACTAQAGELDQCFAEVRTNPAPAVDLDLRPSAQDLVPMADLRQIADFHPEVDRWTERHNRIRITLWSGVWLFGGELDIEPVTVPVGLGLRWEVPGFIGIRLDGAVAYSRLEVKSNGIPFTKQPRSTRFLDGVTHNYTLSLGIFNPELSVAGLAFWAGFGGGIWYWSFDEDDVFGEGTGIDGDYGDDDLNISGHIFVELDYAIADIFHIGLGIRQHFVLAPQTDDGRFYEFNGVEQSFDSGRNDGILDDIALVTEFTLNISIVF